MSSFGHAQTLVIETGVNAKLDEISQHLKRSSWCVVAAVGQSNNETSMVRVQKLVEVVYKRLIVMLPLTEEASEVCCRSSE